ncbi:hypothetical protein AHiyo4_10290 [Arthrobacter sp. Hiyo4]|nr:hypothetical protein AHiyo4_10290 [Arthrobacter sp. Hiyo4]
MGVLEKYSADMRARGATAVIIQLSDQTHIRDIFAEAPSGRTRKSARGCDAAAGLIVEVWALQRCSCTWISPLKACACWASR